ncbi:MAG: type II 3-dehydroquinate dehydratase [Deltaproteobacteria bacterium]|nr:type II 3-dehydroquinate dehydratase [Deltaproteobacteria bacterium]
MLFKKKDSAEGLAADAPRIMVLNGPNLNLLGTREPAVYGKMTLAELEAEVAALAGKLGFAVDCRQSNHEGELVDAVQQASQTCFGVVLNAGGYTHTSVALRDAVAACQVPVVEVHLSNPAGREPFRHVSFLAPVVAGSIAGFGANSYALALMWFARKLW